MSLRGLFQLSKDQPQPDDDARAGWKPGVITHLKKGFGFIEPGNLFFYYGALTDSDFDQLHEGMEVIFQEGLGDKGQPVAVAVRTEQ